MGEEDLTQQLDHHPYLFLKMGPKLDELYEVQICWHLLPVHKAMDIEVLFSRPYQLYVALKCGDILCGHCIFYKKLQCFPFISVVEA